jgi:hypothetical protein
MADFWSQTPNFSNPDYASLEQLAQQRRYAEELQKQSGQDVNRPAGALANIINALTAGLTRNNANQIQSQGAAQNAQAYAEALRQARGPGGWQGVNPDLIGQLGAAPLGSPEQRAFVQHVIQPQTIESPYKEPGSMSPATGVQAPRLPPNYQPGAPFSQAAQGNSQSGVAPPPGQTMPLTPTNPQGGMYGGLNFRPAPAPHLGSGGPGADAGLPPASPPVGPNGAPTRRMSMDELRDWGIKSTFLQEQGKTKTGIMTADLEAAKTVPQLKTIVTTMIDDAQTHGKDWTMGPSAEISLQAKRLAANYAPGLMKDQLEKIASAESFSKMSATLAGATPGVNGSTDAQLVNRIESNPGLHNTFGGVVGLLKMRLQMLDQQQALSQLAASSKTPDDFIANRQKFLDQNPLTNPMTGHPLRIDMESSQKESGGGGFKVLKVH